MSKVTCFVKQRDGTYDTGVSNTKKNEGKFKLGGKTYDAPRDDNHEILTRRHWLWGVKRQAFYRVGNATPIPLDSSAVWRQIHNPDDDKDFLASVIKAALMAKQDVEIRLMASLIGECVIIGLILLHWIFG